MIQMPYDQVIEKIKETSGLSQDEIETKIKAKLDQLSGLISKEGASHIVANELGVKLFEKTSGKAQLKDVHPGMRDLEVVGKVTQVYEVREFQKENRSGKVGSFLIADETKQMRVTCWGSMADEMSKLAQDDTVRIVSGYARENRGYVEIHLNDQAKLIRNPPGITIEKVSSPSFAKATRKKISELLDQEENVELLGTIVQIFDIRFFDSQQGPSYVFNIVLDDGTETIRCALFKNQAERLSQKSTEQMLAFRENPESFSDVKTDLLGQIVKLTGRVKTNDMFQRKEFIAQLVERDPNPEKELERMEANT